MCTKDDLKIGICGKKSMVVSKQTLATNLGNEKIAVFSTPNMIAFMEKTARESVACYLKDNCTTVGIAIDIKHINSVKENETVTCFTELIEIHKKRLVFKCKVVNDDIIIGEGIQQRYIVNIDEFMN
ncbi:MAG: hotdog domain-containing protein [Tissierellia bacterium]|nr:hotdog domain-containing protein [Tissierellia bacterium]